jgi:hypothetical protein
LWISLVTDRQDLELAGVDTPEQLARLGRSFFEGRKDVGPKTLEAIERLAGWPPRTAQDAIARALRLSIPDDEEATAAAGDAICALAAVPMDVQAGR